jgi:CRP/FNR family transcriptional regulator, cyclic AMP receptor protein
MTVTAEFEDLIGEIPLFAMLDAAERAVLAERVEKVSLRKGEVLFRYGDPGNAMFALKSGKVELSVKNKTGEKIIFEAPVAGDIFGEVSLLDEGPRTASAEVIEDGEAIRIDREDLAALFRAKPDSAFDLLAALGRRLRRTSILLRNAVTRNVNEEHEDTRSTVMKVADWIAEFSGSLPFLFIHLGFFALWIILNLGFVPRPFGGFDPFPFGFLTLVVSLEAIILSVFVLLSQNRQIERERVRSDIEYDVNLKAELQIQHLHEKFDNTLSEVLARLERIERCSAPDASRSHKS